MADEAILRYADGLLSQDFTVADAVALEKGQLLQLLDARTVSGVSAASVVCAGICAREKIAGDGRTRVSVSRGGDYDMVASGVITIGYPVVAAGVGTGKNVVKVATTESGAAIIGYALETAAEGETIQVRLRL